MSHIAALKNSSVPYVYDLMIAGALSHLLFLVSKTLHVFGDNPKCILGQKS